VGLPASREQQSARSNLQFVPQTVFDADDGARVAWQVENPARMKTDDIFGAGIGFLIERRRNQERMEKEAGRVFQDGGRP